MSVERWRMPSGRIATIDLSQAPETIEDARRLLRDFGDAEIVKEEAPGAGGNQPEGENQKPAKDSVESKATRRARAAAARPGTVAADHRIIIEDTPDTDAEVTKPSGTATRRHARLADTELARLPLIIRHGTAGRRARIWRTTDGQWWRRGGTVQIRRCPSLDGARAFVVTIWKGANSDDVRFMLKTVERTRRGEDFGFFWDRIVAGWADEHTYTSGTSRVYRDPYTHGDFSQRPMVCDVPLCRSQWHEGDPLHEVGAIDGDGYWINVCRTADEDLWHVDVHADYAEFTPDQVADFVNDLQWMRAECERANAKAADTITELATKEQTA